MGVRWRMGFGRWADRHHQRTLNLDRWRERRSPLVCVCATPVYLAEHTVITDVVGRCVLLNGLDVKSSRLPHA